MVTNNKSHLVWVAAFLVAGSAAVEPSLSADEFWAREEKLDKLKILREASVRADTSPAFLTIPANIRGRKDFDVAKTPPTVDFAIVQGLEPWNLVSLPSRNGGAWGGWGDVSRGPDGCFYFAIGNHQSYGGRAFVIKYDPVAKKQQAVIDTKKVIGFSDDEWADGKLHGDLDVGPGGEMWILTFSGPRPNWKDFDAGLYRGGRLLRHNIFTGETEYLGIPLEGDTWPYHAYDWERGVLFGVGHAKGMLIIYDTRARKLIYGGFPPDGIHWNRRATLLDRETGRIYSSDSPSGNRRKPGDQPHRLIWWERRNNTFGRMNSETPRNPVTGMGGALRAYTHEKDASGAFWCFDTNGTFFKFYPAKDQVEPVGVNWGESGVYATNMSFSPKKRYIYYVPHADADGTPVIQYDTMTNRKKVLAFINDFYLDKYGYRPARAYGVEIDEKGESLFFFVNGVFAAKGMKRSPYRRAGLFHLHIPASERVE